MKKNNIKLNIKDKWALYGNLPVGLYCMVIFLLNPLSLIGIINLLLSILNLYFGWTPINKIYKFYFGKIKRKKEIISKNPEDFREKIKENKEFLNNNIEIEFKNMDSKENLHF